MNYGQSQDCGSGVFAPQPASCCVSQPTQAEECWALRTQPGQRTLQAEEVSARLLGQALARTRAPQTLCEEHAALHVFREGKEQRPRLAGTANLARAELPGRPCMAPVNRCTAFKWMGNKSLVLSINFLKNAMGTPSLGKAAPLLLA